MNKVIFIVLITITSSISFASQPEPSKATPSTITNATSKSQADIKEIAENHLFDSEQPLLFEERLPEQTTLMFTKNSTNFHLINKPPVKNESNKHIYQRSVYSLHINTDYNFSSAEQPPTRYQRDAFRSIKRAVAAYKKRQSDSEQEGFKPGYRGPIVVYNVIFDSTTRNYVVQKHSFISKSI